MSIPIADLAVLLISNGLSADIIGQAIELAQLHAQQSADIRRQSADNPPTSHERRLAYDRERQRKKRESADNPPTPEKQHIDTSPPAASDSQGKKEGVVGRAKSSRGTRLPIDWVLSNKGACFAVPLLGDARTNLEALKFKDFWHAKAGQSATKMDWEAAWRTWVRNVIERDKSNGNRGKGGIMGAADDLLEQVRNLDKPAPRDLRDGTGTPPLRLISER